MMEATVRLAREAGVRVVVVGSPIPFEGMSKTVGYDPDLYRGRFAMLAAVVEAAGGTFVDLHDALPAARFEDTFGHFDAEGGAMLAERLRPVVTRELEAGLRDRRLRAMATSAAAVGRP
jgi:hypothetical protein